MKNYETERGFKGIEFTDSHGWECRIQRSSAIDDTERGLNNPGTSFLWMGVGEHRMHIARNHIPAIIECLQYWYDTGHLPDVSKLDAKEQP